MANDRSVSLTSLPRPPGPTASQNERTSWDVRLYRAIVSMNRAIQNIEGSGGAEVPPSSVPSGTPPDHVLSGDDPVASAATASPGTSLDGSRSDHVHPTGAIPPLSQDIQYLEGYGPVLHVNDGVSDRWYRLELGWSTITSTPMINFTEVFP